MKELPRNPQAEASFLGCLILDPTLVGEVGHLVTERHFTVPAHVAVFTQLQSLYDEGKDIDAVMLSDALARSKSLPGEDPALLVGTLMDSVVSAAHVHSYLDIIREKHAVRSLIETGNRILEDCYGDYGTPDDLLDRAEQAVFDLSTRRDSRESSSLKALLTQNLLQIESRSGEGLLTGLSTGYTELDEMTSGLQKGELVIVAGRPSMGKTSLALDIAEHVGLREKKPVLIFSLEMSEHQISQNMLCSHAKVNSQKLRRNYLSNEEMKRLSIGAGVLAEAPIYIDDHGGTNIRELKSKARRMKARNGIELVIIDYLQLLEGSAASTREGRVQVISEVSRQLKGMARELQIPVIALAQLSRSVESREGNRPRMSDLRESGSIEQDADVIILLYREDYYDPNTKRQGEVDLILAKQRNGPTGEVQLHFAKEFMRFENLSRREEPEADRL
ncbi:MAG: replicative DNA helicase [Planctomycetota bacterium]